MYALCRELLKLSVTVARQLTNEQTKSCNSSTVLFDNYEQMKTLFNQVIECHILLCIRNYY